MKPLQLTHLYPREMNIYGDTGNVVVLRRRLQWRDIAVTVTGVEPGEPIATDTDILLGGGGQDAAQGDIGADLLAKASDLKAMAADGVVMLAICGTYQMLGHEFLTKDGHRIPGAGVLDLVTVGSDRRIIGNNNITTKWGRLVGFENHSGLTTLGDGVTSLGATVAGRGNNGADLTEGAVSDNVFGTYLHGPVLAKSPEFADELIARALRRRGLDAALAPLHDSLAHAAAKVAIGRPR